MPAQPALIAQHSERKEAVFFMFWTNTSCLLLFLASALPGSARADERLWDLLKSGGQVVLIRHTITTPGAGDPPGMRLDDCASQRNLTDAGRRHARRTGEEWRARKIPVERVLSSPWCRCLETARLAHGSTISALTGISPDTGEMVILSQGALAGRLAVAQR